MPQKRANAKSSRANTHKTKIQTGQAPVLHPLQPRAEPASSLAPLARNPDDRLRFALCNKRVFFVCSEPRC